jgi:hypothetical protein
MRTTAGYALRKEEETIAHKGLSHISAEKFLKIGADFEDQKRYPAECFEYHYVNNKDATDGYFLYAWLNNSDNFMVRAYVPPEFEELKVVDMCTNRRAVSTKITGRAWRRFDDSAMWNEHGDGYPVFFGTDIKKILTIKEATNA